MANSGIQFNFQMVFQFLNPPNLAFVPCLEVYTAVNIVKPTISLQNYLRQTNGATFCPSDLENGEQLFQKKGINGVLRPLPLLKGARYSAVANEARETMRECFISDQGSFPWQWDAVRFRGATH